MWSGNVEFIHDPENKMKFHLFSRCEYMSFRIFVIRLRLEGLSQWKTFLGTGAMIKPCKLLQHHEPKLKSSETSGWR